MKGKRVLVTGGAGFIGSHLVDALINEGCYVRVLDNLVNGKLDNLNRHKRNKNFEFILGNITNSKDISKAIKGINIVYHLACLGVRHSIYHPLENHTVNAEGTLKVLDKALKVKVDRFIHISSSEVYGTAKFVPMTEKHPTYPCTVYGASKLAGEAYSRAYNIIWGLNTTIVRLFNTYGPRSHHEKDAGEFIPRSIVRALSGKNIVVFGNGKQTRDFTYVTDSVRALIKTAKNQKTIGKTFNIGNSNEISINKIAKQIIKEIGNPSIKVEYYKSRPGDVNRLCADTALFNKLTNWKPSVSFIDGIKETIKWFKLRPEGIKHLLGQERKFNWK